MKKDKQRNSHKDDESIWTSYSDLFTSVAIIFLMLFVVAVLRSGIKSIETVKVQKDHEEFLEGKISKEGQEKFKNHNDQLQNHLASIKGLESAIQKRTKDIESFTDKVKNQKKLIQEILKEQKKKQAIVDNFSNVIEEKNDKLKESKNQIKEFKSKLAGLNKTLEKEKEEKLKTISKLSKTNKKEQEKAKKLRQDIQELKEKIESKEGSYKDAQISYSKKVKELEEKLLKTNNKIDKKNEAIETYEKSLKEFEGGISSTKDFLKQQANKYQRRITELEVKFENERQIAEKMKVIGLEKDQKTNTLRKQIQEIERALAEVSKQNDELGRKNQTLQTDIQEERKLSQSVKKFGDKKQEEAKKLEGQIKKFKEALADSEKKYESLAKENNNLQGQVEKEKKTIAKLKGESDRKGKKAEELLSKVKEIQGSLAKAKQEKQGLAKKNKELAGKAKELQSLSKELKGQQGELEKTLAGLNAENAKLSSQNTGLKQQNEELAALGKSAKECKEGDTGRSIASVPKTMRERIGHEIVERFKNSNINVKVDRKTGNITLLMDDAFLFKLNSYEITEVMREKLKALIPIYSEVLFSDEKIKDNILAVNIIGHASPSYKTGMLDPREENQEAYNYNLLLSTSRATQILTYVLGQDMGKFEYRDDLKRISIAAGRSYSKPVYRNLASLNQVKNFPKKTYTCKNVYDCRKSRRVEISFTLKREDI